MVNEVIHLEDSAVKAFTVFNDALFECFHGLLGAGDKNSPDTVSFN